MINKILRLILCFVIFALVAANANSATEEKLTVSYSSVDAPTSIWYIAQEQGFYKKYGMDVESIFIPSSTTGTAVMVAGQIKFGSGTGGMIANAAVSGANLIAVGCFFNTLDYDLIVHESIKTKEQLKGKSVGISRIGSSSDVAARALLRSLGLEPDKDVAIIQVGGSAERAAAFGSGKIAAFPATPGAVNLTKGMRYRLLTSTADSAKPYPFPHICATTTKTYLANNRPTVKKLLMALIDAAHFFRTHKDESKKLLAKYTQHNEEAYLEAAYTGAARLIERVPHVTREGMGIQLKDALTRKPGMNLKADDLFDDSIVVELEKEGFIDKLYKP
jgi:ABC-type nitrate/sulfonate/bicarbonate transport system substrate-binding protein